MGLFQEFGRHSGGPRLNPKKHYRNMAAGCNPPMGEKVRESSMGKGDGELEQVVFRSLEDSFVTAVDAHLAVDVLDVRSEG